jgi:hypothetical protein
LLIRRTLGEDPQYGFFISDAMSITRLNTLVWLSGLRWAIEQSFQRPRQNWAWTLRGPQVFRLAPAHHDPHAGRFLPQAPENQDGKKSTVHYSAAA